MMLRNWWRGWKMTAKRRKNGGNEDLKFALLLLAMAFSVVATSIINGCGERKEPQPVYDSIYYIYGA